MPEDPVTSFSLILATLASATTFAITARRMRVSETDRLSLWPMFVLLGAVMLLCDAAFAYRVFYIHHAWQPVQAHVDGLLLLSILLTPAVIYIQTRPKLFGLSLFALPLLTLILLWAVCASFWTYRPFKLDTFEPAWVVFHTTATYFGLLGCGLGAAAGAMYLFVQRRIKSKAGLTGVTPMASLETLETLIIRTATLGFVLLTLSLVSGLVLVTQSEQATSLGTSWWTSPKFWLASLAWLVYALLINVRAISTFRGRRAAWLSIAGLVLVFATYGAVEAMGSSADRDVVTDPAQLNAQPEGRSPEAGGGG